MTGRHAPARYVPADAPRDSDGDGPDADALCPPTLKPFARGRRGAGAAGGERGFVRNRGQGHQSRPRWCRETRARNPPAPTTLTLAMSWSTPSHNHNAPGDCIRQRAEDVVLAVSDELDGGRELDRNIVRSAVARLRAAVQNAVRTGNLGLLRQYQASPKKLKTPGISCRPRLPSHETL